jgi:polyisoprenoid-binding protein YceI
MTTTTTSSTGLRTFTIDKAHSEATFQVRHLITKVRGRFRDFEGTIQFDESNPEQSSVSFTIKTDSIDTSEPDRDNHLRSNDFFAVADHPTITFASARAAHQR